MIHRERGPVMVARLSISLPQSLAEYVRSIAIREETSVSAVIRDAVKLHRRVREGDAP